MSKTYFAIRGSFEVFHFCNKYFLKFVHPERPYFCVSFFPTLRGKALFTFPLQSFYPFGKGWLNWPWMLAMALMRLRPMRLTLLSPRGRFSLCLNSGLKCRVSVSQSPQLLAFDKTVVTHNNFPPQYLPLTITTCRPAFLTLVLPTSVNSICLRAFSTNRLFSRKSQNSESPFRKTEGTAPAPT